MADRYRIIELLGAGGMSQVYSAEDRLTHRLVALKRMHVDPRRQHIRESQASASGDALSLAQEFRALVGLRHPHIVPVLDYGFDAERRPFLAMQLIPDAQILTDAAKPLTLTGKTELLLQVLNALQYLHRRGVIHRDIKPPNILVGSDGVARLLDFGLAVNAALSLVASKNGLAGTIAYMAPELFQTPVATAQSDLYSLGIIAYEMFTGVYPFVTGTPAMLMYHILHSQPDLSRLDAPLAEAVGRMIARNPAERFQTAREAMQAVCRAAGLPEPLESQSIQDSFLQASQFVGRRQELDTLKAALDRILPAEEAAPDGAPPVQGSAWLVSGESGVGKSRLLDEVRVRAVVRGVLVLQGQAVAAGGQTYQVWREPLRRLMLATDISPEDAAVLKELAPDIEALLGYPVSEIAPLNGRDQQQRLIQSIVAAFRQQKQPVLLILEDLHWTIESLEPLKRLLDYVAELPLVIVASYRRDEASDLPRQLPGMQRIRLKRLSGDDVALLSASILGEVGRRRELVRLLQRQTEGNPLFVVEAIRALAQAAGRLDDIGRTPLPESVLAGGVTPLVQRRLDRVPPWARPMLRAAATMGRDLDLAALEAIYRRYSDYTHSDDYRLDQWLTVCLDSAVLEVANGVCRLSHETLRDVLLQSLPDDERAMLHRLAADTLERMYPDDASRAGILLDHWYHAGDVDKEIGYLLQVVAQHIDFATGVEMTRRLIERSLSRLAEDDPRRSLLLVYLSQTYMRVDYAHGETIGRQALEAARRHHDDRATAQALYVLATHVREQMRYDEARDYNQQSLAWFERLGDARGSANNLVSLGIISHDALHYEAARDHYEQALAIYQQLGDEGRIAFLEVLIGTLTRDQQRYEEAIVRIEHGLDIARRIGQYSVISHALNNLGVIATEQSDFAKATDYLSQSLTVNRDIGNQWGVANADINLGFAYLMCDDDASARTHLTAGTRHALTISAMNLALEGVIGFGWLLERGGDYAQAARLVGMAEPTANIDVNRRIVPLLARLERALSADDLRAARQAGAALTLEGVVAGLLEGRRQGAP